MIGVHFNLREFFEFIVLVVVVVILVRIYGKSK